MKKKSFVIVVVVLFFVVTGIWYLLQENKENEKKELPSSVFLQIEQEKSVLNEDESFGEGNTEIKEEKMEEKLVPIFVHVCGAVQKSGVYQLYTNDRLYMAIELAGGFTKEAAKEYHNLARIVEDGERIYILTKEELEQLSTKEQIEGELLKEGKVQESKPLVNLNKASLEELMTLSGIGESKAKSIIEYRTKVGEFKNIEELMNISGIGEAMFEKVKDEITIK